MSFLRDFAGTFLQQLNKEIDTREDKAEERKDREETLARQNLANVKIRGQRATEGARLAYAAKALGANDAQIAAAFNNGMAGIQEFHQKLSEARDSMGSGVTKLSPDEVEALIDISDIPDMKYPTYEEMARQVYGANKTVAEPKAEIPGWAKMLGLSADEEMKRKLGSTPFAGDLSVQQINDMVAEPEYSKMAGMESSYLNYTKLPTMGEEKGADWSISLNEAIVNIEDSDEFKAFAENAERAVREKYGAIELTPEMKREAAQNSLDAEAKYIKDRIGVTIESTIDVYKQSFFKNNSVLNLFDRLIKKGIYTQDEFEKMISSVGIKKKEEIIDPEEAREDSLNLEPVVGGSTEADEDDEKPVVPTITVGGEEVGAAIPLDPTQQELVDNFMEGRIGPLEDNVSTTVTKDQWDKMSRQERRNNNLPVSKLGASTYYFRDDIDELLADKDSKGLIAQVKMKNNPVQEFYRVKFPGELKARFVTKDQLALIPDSAILSRKVKISSFQEGERKTGRRASNEFLEKVFGTNIENPVE
tara:strand:+ start:1274 stop:2869 length:1596 start_codon:yes stop_codon:yes gene_type:complete